jgi:fatty-acyl-CoA synthase
MVPETPGVVRRLMLDGPAGAYESYEAAVASYSSEPLEEEPRGAFMLYSSGTTGRPKGVKFPLPAHDASEGDVQILVSTMGLYDLQEGDVYLSPAPLYHSAPLRTSQVVQCAGGTVIVMERFDPLKALECIEKYRVSASQWVPTMFVRMLKLDEAQRNRFDLSSHRVAVHAAAPCPVEVKEKMIEWWGPMFVEYYAGTESFGTTALNSTEWLAHRGSVGKPYMGTVHICDDDGRELPEGETGLVYFDTPGAVFEYHNDPEKTSGISHPEHPGWRTLGDVGHVDADGYLYLSDRASFMIVSGGVNIYPQEIEDVLVVHPKVMDAAVFGIPNSDFGEEVKAVVQPKRWEDAAPEMAQELLDYCQANLAHFKCPKSIDFEAELPRLDNGKLYKRHLRDRYWAGHASRVL